MSGLTLALRLLTVLPAPGALPEPEGPAGRSTAWFPLVGAFLGAAAYLVLELPVPRTVAAALALGTLALLTGAMHEDGLMDAADALLVHGSRERRIDVLSDPRVGAYGVTAGVVVLLTRFALLTAISAMGILVAPVVGRWVMSVSLARTPSLRTGGLGASFAEGARPGAATLSAVAVLGLLLTLVSGVPAPAEAVARVAAAGALGGTVGWGVAGLLVRRLGGVNGDGHGTVGYLAETAALFAFVPLG